MASLRYVRSFAIGLSLLSVAASPAFADCPDGSGVLFPDLTEDEFRCQRVSLNATVDYFYNFIGARLDCYTKEITDKVDPEELDCLAAITAEGPATTGDEETDRRLRVNEAQMTSAILNGCTGVALENIGYPGFCEDGTPGTPYDAFDHLQCLLTRVQELGTFLLTVEHPDPFVGDLEFNEQMCLDQIGRLSSRMTTTEFDRRGHCLLAQVRGDLEFPPEVDCRREVDPQAPGINRPYTDDAVVESHNHILVYLPNSCPAINIENLGFPWMCDGMEHSSSVFSLPVLVQCMFDYHHHDVFRLIDLIFPCSTKCGNGVINVEEDCDDGDNEWREGDFCRRDCGLVSCGDTDDDGVVGIRDALYILLSAVGLEECTLLICDVTGDLRIRTSDALRALQFAVGLPVELECPDVSPTCGNGFLEEKEGCDDGDSEYDRGEFCNSACLLVDCADTDDTGSVDIIDALYILNVTVGNLTCDLAVCDITGNLLINSTDALRTLMHSVGVSVFFNCPAPPETPPAPPIE